MITNRTSCDYAEALVSEGVNRVRETGEVGTLLITHYTRILRYIKPDHVHVFAGGIYASQATPDMQVFALHDICSHANVSLSEGEVEDCQIECWLHGSSFDLRTGKPSGLPATRRGKDEEATTEQSLARPQEPSTPRARNPQGETMSVLAVLVLLVALLLALAGLALATGLGYLAHRRPTLAQPIGITLTALGVFTAIVIGILQALTP